MLTTKVTDLVGKAKGLLAEVKTIVEKVEQTAEDKARVIALATEVKAIKDDAMRLSELEKAAGELAALEVAGGGPAPASQFKSLGEFAQAIYRRKFHGEPDPRLGRPFSDPTEPATPIGAEGWVESKKRDQKTLVESVGASGGYLVPVQQQATLLQVPGPAQVVRPRATVVPMARRQIQWPALDQTNTTSGRPAWYGGVLARWTEEAAEKDETEPKFRQINLVAHKLVCYTEAGDELLEDSAVSLEALLNTMFSGAVNWYEEEAFVNGTGAGQPLGVIPAGATFHQNRQAAGAISIVDIINMLEHFFGSNPVWLASRSALPSIMQLNGPAANPSYVFMPSARDGMPSTLFGYPIEWCEHCPFLGSEGDIGLYDFKMYLVGDRKATAIDASKDYKFREDLTTWRAVHRVDGQPWLSQPIYWSDGQTQVSPFVILDDAVGS